MAGTAIVREVSPRLAAGELTHRRRVGVDLERARVQWAGYVAMLWSRGWRLRQAAAQPELPDAVFVEDTATVVDPRFAILARPGAPSRRSEPSTIEPVLGQVVASLGRIVEPGILDGGDVLGVGETLFVGLSTRTNRAALDQVAELVRRLGRRVVGVDVEHCLHLKTAATALPDGAVVVWEPWIDIAAFDGSEIVRAEEPSGANVLVVGPAAVGVAASAPDTAHALRRRGLEVTVVDISEFEAREAGLTCLSLLVPGRPSLAPDVPAQL